MIEGRPILVVDTNIVVCAFSDWDSPSGLLMKVCEERASVRLLLSREVVAEYRKVLGYEKIALRHPEITSEEIETVLKRLRYISEYHADLRVRFRFDRDRDDEKFLHLAIAGDATHIVTFDGDLLALGSGHSDAAKRLRRRLPGVQILRPEQFLTSLGMAKL